MGATGNDQEHLLRLRPYQEIETQRKTMKNAETDIPSMLYSSSECGGDDIIVTESEIPGVEAEVCEVFGEDFDFNWQEWRLVSVAQGLTVYENTSVAPGSGKNWKTVQFAQLNQTQAGIRLSEYHHYSTTIALATPQWLTEKLCEYVDLYV